MEKPELENKTAIVLEKDLLSWQKLNVAAFLASAIAKRFPETMGEDFVDASGISYPGIFRVPVVIFAAEAADLRRVYERAKARELVVGIYTRKIFETQGDQNLEAVASSSEAEHDLVGLVFYGPKNKVNKAVDGLKLHA